MKYRLAIMLLALTTAVAYAQVSAPAKSATAGKNYEETRSVATAGAASGLPAATRSNISAALGMDDHSYEISKRAGSLTAENSEQELSAVFKPGGVHIRTGEADLGMALVGYGYGDHLRGASSVIPRANQNRVEYRRGTLTEWYENGPFGLEQGFTLAKPPALKRDQPLTIALALSGDFTPSIDQGGTQLTLTDGDQSETLLCGEISSYDANGKQLRTWMEVRGRQLRLRVEDSAAVYPLVVDPWVQKAVLTVSNASSFDFLGNAISVSEDGKTVVVAAAQKSRQQGTVYVFEEPSKGWATTSKFKAQLTASDGKAGDNFGASAVISADGKTIVVGAPQATVGTNYYQGKVYVFVEPSTGWATTNQFNAELTASDGASYDWLGMSVAFDNQSVVAGAYGHTVNGNPYQGAAYVFTEPSSGWTNNTQNAELTSSDGAAWDLFGYSAGAFNGVAAIGAIQATVGGNQSQGAAYVYVAPSTGWANATENAKLVAAKGMSEDLLGSSIAVSSDTTTVVVGAEAANVLGNGGQGAVYVFTEPSGGWAGEPLNETARLTASDGVQEDYFGTSVALDYGGDTIAVGAPLARYFNTQKHTGPGPGRAYTFVKPTNGWATTDVYTQELGIKAGKYGAEYGISVGINSTTLAVGSICADPQKKTDQGAAFIAAN